MEELVRHYRVLGVDVRSSATEIQQAFRSRIKLAHPDRSRSSGEEARTLIEAYRAIRHAPLQKADPRLFERPRSHTVTEEAPARPARREAAPIVVGEPRMAQFFDKLSDIIYADDNEWAVYGAHDEIQEFLYFKSRKKKDAHEEKKADEYFDRAEELLRLIVARYNRMSNKKARSWSRNYIANLVELKVLYRDVANRYPLRAVAANRRLSQIEDLIWEIRKMG